MPKQHLKHYITSDVYEAAFFWMVTDGECRPKILIDNGREEALFSYHDIDAELPVRYRKSDIPAFKRILIDLKVEMFRILDKARESKKPNIVEET